MEIGALSSSLAASYLPHTAEGSSLRARPATRDSVSSARGQSGTDSSSLEKVRDANTEARRKEILESRDPRQTDIATSGASPHIQFKDSEGTRVMEVYDNKNVLIYQVPPKGALMLIQNEEKQANSRVETSA